MIARPTAELAGKHEIAPPRVDATTFRTGWLIETRLDGLLADRLITVAGHVAARRWRRDWETAMERTRGIRLEAGRMGSGFGSAGPPPRLAALGRLRAVELALGRFAVRLLEWCLVRDAPWTQTAGRLHCSDKTARRWTAHVIAALAAHQRLADRAGNPEIPGPDACAATGQGD